MLKNTIRGLALASILPSSASAMTGAELLQAERPAAYGYVLGVIEIRISVVHEDDPQFSVIRECILQSGANVATLYNVVSGYIANHPAQLTMPAVSGVVNAMADMCGTAR